MRTKQTKCLLKNQSGATALEYCLIVALIFLAVILAVGSVASNTNAMWGLVSSTVTNATK
jgi:pilus assembly protein Flp/PilA